VVAGALAIVACQTQPPLAGDAALRVGTASPGVMSDVAPAADPAGGARAITAVPDSAPTVRPDIAALARELASPQRSTASDRVEQILSSMDLAQKVGQRIVTWIEGVELTPRTRELVTETNIAGIILTAANISGSDQLRKLTSDLQALARTNHPALGLLVAVDQEGGRVARLRLPEVTRLPAAAVWAAAYDADYVESVAYILGRELLFHGANLNLAPVLDLATLPADSVIGDRAFSPDPRAVAELGTAYVLGAARARVLATGKHFPGHGATTVDSHLELPRVSSSRLQLQSSLLPFQSAIDAGVPVIMSAHILFPQIDPQFPATFSSVIMRDILRGDLGFDGVVMSDAMEMRSIAEHYSLREIALHSMRAGIDLILLADRFDAKRLHAELLDVVAVGELDETIIDEGVRRVLRLKLAQQLIEPGLAGPRG
jgi:beta-N-acetylhexosaminidase